MNKTISINTPEGIIEASLNKDPEFPAINIRINDEYVAVVEYDTLKERFCIRTYQGDCDEPYVNYDYINQSE